MLRHFLLVLCFTSQAFCASPDSAWPDVTSDLEPDPTVRRGTLANGLRYVIRPNAEPRERVSLRFLVAAGSLHERDDERGLAHFLEHMVFRGTRQHPNGSMAEELQRLGIAFGPDSTAFTHHGHTIYHLDLPDTRESTIRHGLSIFREYASDVTFAPELIERERGVILSEMHTRDTPDARAGQANLAFLWPESLQVQRAPIGVESSIRSFTRDQFIAFYDAWYRPERMAVIVVGDIAPETVERLVIEALSSIKSRGPPREDLPSVIPTSASKPNIQIFTDPGLIGASCVLQHPFAEARRDDTRERRVELLHRGLAFTMFQRRLTKEAAQADGPSISPSTSVGTWMPGWTIPVFGSTGKIVNWREFISDIEQQHRRAFLHGFTTAELRAAILAYSTAYDDAVRTSATWPSGWIAEQLATALVEGTVFSTPTRVQEDAAPALRAVTNADCLRAFRAAWSTRPPHVFIATHPDFQVTATEVGQALNASRLVATPAMPETGDVTFAYTDFGPTNAPVREWHVSDLNIHQAEFANGVRLNFKETDFEADTLSICIRVGRGKLSQPAHQPGLDLLANHLVGRGGVGRHTFEELEEILNGHTIDIRFIARTDAFEFSARCARRDLQLCLQVITAQLTDSAYRASARRQVDAIMGSMYANLAASAGGPVWVHGQRILTGGDLRFGVPTTDEAFARTIPELKEWLEPEFQQGAIELGIAGAGAWEDVRDAVAQTLATLPQRTAAGNRRDDTVRMVKPSKGSYIFTTAPQLKQVALAWYCPVPDLADMHQERRCRLLADLMTERLRIKLRDELGAAYGCSAMFNDNPGLPAFSYFSIYAEVAPEHAQHAARLMENELTALRKGKFTADEFERVKQPFLRQRAQDLRNNMYWAHTVLRDAQERPERLSAARDRTTDTAAITRRDLEKLARKYFVPKRSFQFVAYPSVPPDPRLNFGLQ